MKLNPILTWIGICILAFVATGQLKAQEEFNDFITLTNAPPVPGDLPLWMFRPPPVFPTGEPPPASPSPTIDFPGPHDSSLSAPPDSHGAVGESNVVTMINTEARIQTRTGTIVATTNLAGFWSGVGSYTTITDPRILYDPVQKRWIACAIVDPFLSTSSLLLGVSKSENPAFTNWNRYRFDVDANNNTWADYPTMGFNQKWISVQLNMIPLTTNGQYGSLIYVFTKTNYFAGSSNAPRTFSGTFTNSGWGQFPATTYDTNESSLYFVQNVVGHYDLGGGSIAGLIRLWRLSGAIGSESLSQVGLIGATPWADKVNEATTANVDSAPQLGSSTIRILNNDSRILSVVQRNGRIWATHNIFLPYNDSANARTAVQWWQIGTNGSVFQNGRIDDNSGATYYAFGSIAVNRFNDALIGYSVFSTNQYPSSAYSFRPFYGVQNEMDSSRSFKSGTDLYWKTYTTGTRWGDYSATVVDPLNDADFWTIQEYATNHFGTLTNFSGRWATWWAKVAVEFPGNDNFANSYPLSGASGTTNGNNIRATKESGEPNHAGDAGTASVWYHWTPPAAGNVIIDTIGSDYSTILAVYTGSSASALTLVTNDIGSAGNGASRVIFNAAASTTYRIAVDGVSGSMGNIVLNYNQPTTPVFVTNPQSQTKYEGENVTFTSQAVGNPAASYQWRFNAANISGATSSSYTITGITTNNAGNYTVVATNTSGSVTSAVAVLTVLTSQGTLSGPLVTNNTFQFTVSQVSGLNYIIQANTNLSTTNWSSISTNTAPFTITDTAFTNNSQRFYRAIYKP